MFNSKPKIINNFPKNTTKVYKIGAIFIFLITSIVLFPRRNLLKLDDYKRSYKTLQKGDIVLVGDFVEVSGLIIRGVVTHALIYNQDQKLIHAVGNGVEEIEYKKLFKKYDTLIIIRLSDLFGDKRNVVVDQVVQYCKKQIGKPYDFTFRSKNEESFVCSQLVNMAYKHAYLENELDITVSHILYPSDFLKRKEFQHIFHSDSLRIDKYGRYIRKTPLLKKLVQYIVRYLR